MSTYFDVLVQGGALGQCDFTVDNAVNFVNLNLITDPAGLPFRNPQSFRGWFAKGDSPLLQSVTPHLPYQFGQAAGEHIISIGWEDNLGGQYALPEVSHSSVVFPSLCDKVLFPGNGVLLKTPVVANPLVTKFRLYLSYVECSISQISAPDSLNGEVFSMSYYLQTQHSAPLTA